MKKTKLTQSIYIYQILIVLGFTFLLLRLFWLQVIQHPKYSTLAEHNRIRVEPLQARRGKLIDRHGDLLADNRQSFQYIYQQNNKNAISPQLPIIHKCLPRTPEVMPTPNQSVISRRLSTHELSCLAFYDDLTPSFNLEPRLVRHYPYGAVTSHLLGYMAPPTTEQLISLTPMERKAIVHMGRSGIENLYEKQLRGTPGWRQREVNAKGKQIRQMDEINSVTGQDIKLTLDARLQKIAYDALGDHVGTFIVLDPNDGSLLVLVSKPSFDANTFSYGIPTKLYQQLLEDPLKPLYNRATQGLYPPASTIKPYYALAGLEEGVITAQDKIYDRGWFTLDNSKHVFHDWRRSGHGIVDVERAISVSCDTYFYGLSIKLGITRMNDWLTKFGYGQAIASPLTARTGLVPTPEWKKSRKQAWTGGDTVITGIGQGSLLVTPIQAALTLSRIAMRGKGYALRLRMDETPVALPPIIAKTSSWDHVINGMKQVVTGTDGTAHRLQALKLSIAAKTGTAQVVSLDRHKGKRQHRDHNWFVGFTPAESPEIVFVVLIEHEHTAVQVAERFLEQWKMLEKVPTAAINA